MVMAVLSQNSYNLTALAEMPMAELIAEAQRLGNSF
jgi:hypothetical protein